ncbi:baeRF2 domain-containing protein [Parafrankia elaeagni]|uniref:baeRF2 domain-containing protein n=1 Tax=Parafrankia elaeagni TaxID=222534 RepID=UPI00036CAF3E|nr:Vms1/Ankzf1 family peptidyl-tRNA hydrolase [Parafrankia elaeagni]
MDISALRSLYTSPGRFVTAYASIDPVLENAAHQYDLRWRDLATELERRGAGREVCELFLAERGDPHQREGGTRVVVVSGEGKQAHVPFAHWLPGRSDVDLVDVGALPHLLPVLNWMDSRLPHAVAVVDRLGVDVLGYVDGPLPTAAVSQDTTRPPWHKARQGGWAQRRFESHVEEHWKRGAKDDAELIARATHETAAEVVILAGDTKALSLVREELPRDVAARVVVVQGSRARDGSVDHLADRVMGVLAAEVERRRAGLLDEFQQYRSRARSLVGARRGAGAGRGPGNGAGADAGVERSATGAPAEGRPMLAAADGPAATAYALSLSQVSHLLLAEDGAGDGPAWVGDDVTEIAVDPSGADGLRHPVRASRVDALVRAALGTGATVHTVVSGAPGSPGDGVGALLRYSAAHPPTLD